MNLGLWLIILSPFTAWIPLLKWFMRMLRSKTGFTINPLHIGLLVLFFWSVVSGLMNGNRLSVLTSGVFLLYFGLCVWFENYCYEEEHMLVLIEQVWKISLVSAFIGIGEKIISTFWDISWIVKLFWNPTYFPTKMNYRILSTFGNPNVAGDWFGIMTLVSLYLMDQNYGKKRIVYGLSSALFAVNLFLTGSKGAFIGFFVAIVAYSLMKNCKKTWIIFGLMMSLVVALLVLFPNVYETVNPRNEIWAKCFELIKKQPIVGWSMMGIYQQIHEVHAHNIWISLFTALGLVGFVAFLGIKWYLIESIYNLIKKKMKMVQLLLAVQVFIFSHGIFDFTIIAPQVGILFISTCAMISALAVHNLEYPETFKGLDYVFDLRRMVLKQLPQHIWLFKAFK